VMATSTCQSRDCANPGTKVPGDELPQQAHLVDGSPRLSVNAFSIDDGTVKVSERLVLACRSPASSFHDAGHEFCSNVVLEAKLNSVFGERSGRST
jgi:hypothetical protein